MELLREDLRRVVRRIPKKLKDELGQGRFIGGGFIREVVSGGEVKDIDMFVGSLEDATALAEAVGQNAKQIVTDNAITITKPGHTPMQVIKRWTFTNAQDLLESFDFTVCQAVIWKDKGTWKSLVGEKFYIDLASRRLRYLSPARDEDAGGSMMRVMKFLRRGFHIPPEELAKVLSRMVKKSGVSTPLITAALREVDPLYILDGEAVEEDETLVELGELNNEG